MDHRGTCEKINIPDKKEAKWTVPTNSPLLSPTFPSTSLLQRLITPNSLEFHIILPPPTHQYRRKLQRTLHQTWFPRITNFKTGQRWKDDPRRVVRVSGTVRGTVGYGAEYRAAIGRSDRLFYSVILSVLDPRKCEYLKNYSLDFEHAYMTTYLASWEACRY